MKKRAAACGVLLLSLLLANSCVINTGSIGESRVGMPHEASKVAGGYKITYLLPEDGTVLLVDQKTGKHILSQSMQAGSEFRFDALEVDREQYKRWGINPDKANFVLYFHPKNPKMKPKPETGVVPLGGTKDCKE